MSEKKRQVYLTLPENMYERVSRLAEETGRSKCKYIRQIIRRYLVYLDRRDDPDAPPVEWDIDKPWW